MKYFIFSLLFTLLLQIGYSFTIAEIGTLPEPLADKYECNARDKDIENLEKQLSNKTTNPKEYQKLMNKLGALKMNHDKYCPISHDSEHKTAVKNK